MKAVVRRDTQPIIRTGPGGRRAGVSACRILGLTLLSFLMGCGGQESDGKAAVPPKPTDAAYLEAVVTAISQTLPTKINKYTEIMSVSAIPSGLRYNIRMIHMPAHTVDHKTLRVAQHQIAERSCGDERERLELDAGVALHYVVHGMEAESAGRFFISDVFCKARGL